MGIEQYPLFQGIYNVIVVERVNIESKSSLRCFQGTGKVVNQCYGS